MTCQIYYANTKNFFKSQKGIFAFLLSNMAVLFFLFLPPFSGQGRFFAQSVAINAIGAAPNASALLDIDASPGNNKGLLIPRISLTSTTDVITIPNPATSLLVYNINAAMTLGGVGYWYWDGTKWVALLNNSSTNNQSAWLLTGNAGTTAGTNFIGTTDIQDLVFKTNNTEWMRILSGGNVGIGAISPSRRVDIDNGTPGTDGLSIRTISSAPATNPWSIILSNDLQQTNGFNPWMIESRNDGAFNLANGLSRMWIMPTGNVGIGTAAPTAKLELQGQIKIVDGTEGIGKVLTSDAVGLASWQTPLIFVRDCSIWSTGTAGSYDLKTIFDAARTGGMPPGVYDCVLRTNNGAHWTGRKFIALANFYLTNVTYPHRFVNELDISTGVSGCSLGLTFFDISTGLFSFDPGNCFQTISLVCTCQTR